MRRLLYIIAVSLLLALPMPSMAADAPKDYLLDDVGGTEYALYPGHAYRSAVDPKDSVASLQDLEAHALALPTGANILWNPARRDGAGKPMLFGTKENTEQFQAFCQAHHIQFDIAPPPLQKP
jgi:hypothetical protein